MEDPTLSTDPAGPGALRAGRLGALRLGAPPNRANGTALPAGRSGPFTDSL